MKDGTARKIKTAKLARLLGVDLTYAVGLLNMLWSDFAPLQAPMGNVGKFDDGDIVTALGSSLDAVKVIAALVDAQWLCGDARHRLVIHDWPEHMEQRVKHKLQRAGLAPIQCSCREQFSSKAEQSPDVVQRTDAVRTPSGPARGIRQGLGIGLGKAEGSIAPECRGQSLTRAPVPALERDDSAAGLVLLPRLRAHAAAVGCTNADLAWAHWHTERWKRRDDTRSWVTDWYADFEAWLLNHDRYGCPCQVRTKPPGDTPMPDAMKRALERGRRATA